MQSLSRSAENKRIAEGASVFVFKCVCVEFWNKAAAAVANEIEPGSVTHLHLHLICLMSSPEREKGLTVSAFPFTQSRLVSTPTFQELLEH